MFVGGAQPSSGLSFTSTNYQAIYDEMTTPPSDAEASRQDVAVKALEDGGIWADLDYLLYFAQESDGDGEARLNWISPTDTKAEIITGLTFTALEGFTNPAGNGYMKTHFNPAAIGNNCSQDDLGFGLYLRTSSSIYTWFAVYDASGNRIRIGLRQSASIYYYINQITDADYTGVADMKGLHIAQRTASNAIKVYHNNSQVDAETDASSGLVSGQDPWLFALNNNGALAAIAQGDQIAYLFVGKSLDATKRELIEDIMEVLLDANGKGVIP